MFASVSVLGSDLISRDQGNDTKVTNYNCTVFKLHAESLTPPLLQATNGTSKNTQYTVYFKDKLVTFLWIHR